MASLTIVGTGIVAVAHVTLEALEHIRGADELHYLMGDPLTERWLIKQNRRARSLKDCYEDGRSRVDAYERMAARIVDACATATRVCAAFYGHAGVLCLPAHKAVQLARSRGFRAVMLPGISTVDCLYADLGIDPATHGCQEFDATDFVIHQRQFDPSVALILWQVGLIGQFDHRVHGWSTAPVRVLAEVLRAFYPSDHPVAIYRAAEFPTNACAIAWVTLERLPSAAMDARNTLYIPPGQSRRTDLRIAERVAATLVDR